jgi:RHS repeat-associated protein
LSDGTSFTYDDNGNRTQKTKGTDTWVYTYDYANRLTEIEENSTTLEECVYDGNGKRIQVTDDSKTTIYIYSGLNVLYEETMNSAATYIYGPVGRVAKRITINQQHNTYYYHTDHLGSTRLITDETKNIVESATYHPFGESNQEGSEDYLFTGKECDATGLYYYGARYYDPEIGRFITRDPLIGRRIAPQSLNRYTYCLNNPIKYTDPDGYGEKFSYLKTHPNPIRLAPMTIINGFVWGVAGLATALAALGLFTIPPVAFILLWAIPGILELISDGEGYTWQEDMDRDGGWETIVEYRNPDGKLLERLVIEEDGTTYRTLYTEGSVFKWKMIPDLDDPDSYTVYIWDEETEQWFLDQDQDGIPDSLEETNNDKGNDSGGSAGGGGCNNKIQ